MSIQPSELHYCSTHEWIHLAEEAGRTIGTVGISAFAVEQLTDLVFMALPKIGTKLQAGQEFGEVESVKAVSPLYSPASGEVIAVNDDLPNHLETLGSDPYNQGWMIKIALSDPTEVNKLMDHAAYSQQCAESH